MFSQRDWARRMMKSNPMYRRIKIRYTTMCYIKPRMSIPAKGKPVLYTCEGVENWTGTPKLLCPGQVLLYTDRHSKVDLRGSWVVIAVVWIGCLTRRVKGEVRYCCASPSLRTLLCKLEVFDKSQNVNEIQKNLRY